MNRIHKSLFLVLVTLSWVANSQAQTGSREYNTREPYSQDGTQANAPIPAELHQQNTGGSDGAGLCVIASIVAAGRYLDLPETEKLWEEAKKRPGGYYPEKADQLAREVAPELKYAHYVGSDYETLKGLSEQGLAFGVTMDTGELYGGRSIEHMVTGVHFDDRYACIIDNNRPGVFVWVTREEWERRSKLNRGTYWAWILQPGPQSKVLLWVAAGAIVLMFLAKPKRIQDSGDENA